MSTKSDEKIALVMESLTNAVIASLEAGIADPTGWVAPWHKITAGAVNATTKRQYNGGNFLLLSFLGEGPWATFKQWQSVGAMVRKGEHGIPILVPVPVRIKQEAKDGGKDKIVSFTRYRTATVFQASQVDGWNAPAVPVNPEPRIADADAWLQAWGEVVPVTYSPNRAYYVPALDTISLPPFDTFKSADGFYSTAFHEAGHSTGHPSRLKRNMGDGFGTPSYAREELVAELTSAFMGQHFGIHTELADHNRDYLANWLRVLKNDHTVLWDAASDASKAARMLLDVIAADGEDEPDGE